MSRLKSFLKMRSESDFMVLLRYLAQLKWRLVYYFMILALVTIMEGFGLGMLIPILQSLTNQGDTNIFVEFFQKAFSAVGIAYTFPTLIGIFTVIILCKYFLAGYERHLTRVLSSERTYDLRNRAFCNLMEVPIGFFYRSKIGNLISTQITSCQNVGALIEYTLLEINAIFFCLLYLTINSLISLQLTMMVIGMGAVSYLLIIPRLARSKIQGNEEKTLLDELNSFLFDTLSGIKLVKAFYNEKNHVVRYEERINRYRDVVVKILDNRIIASLFIEPLLFILAVGALVVAVKFLEMSLISVMAFLFVFIQLLPRIKTIYQNNLLINELIPHFKNVQALVSLESRDVPVDRGLQIFKIEQQISFKRVSYWYPETERPSLHDISLTIPVGKTIAIVGGSGGGKTTLLDMLLRLHDPKSGQIEVDGTDLREFRIADWRRMIGVVEQDCFLFHDSIYNNITYGLSEVSWKDVEQAAHMAHIAEFIAKFPKGYETIVGNRGMNLSGGQKQRLALARALLRNPEILVLDEATSALDSESEALIQGAISQFYGKKTIVIVSHRLSTIRNADYIYILEQGEIVEEGTHDSLKKLAGKYGAYFRYQHQLEN